MNTSHVATIRVGSPADLLASIPAVLGFHPTDSLVLMAHDELTDELGAMARLDFTADPDGLPDPECTGAIRDAGRMLRQQGVDRVLIAAVTPGYPPDRLPELAIALERLLGPADADDIDVVDVFLLPRIGVGRRWTCRHGVAGRVADPETCAAAIAALVAGRMVHASRAEMVAELAETGSGVGARACRGATPRSVPDAQLLAELVAAVTVDDPIPDAALARLGGALLRIPVRDAAMGLAAGERAITARSGFAALARGLRGTPRAAAATLAAALAYLRGDGPAVGIALAAALDADPRYRAARLLSQAFDAGLRPDEMVGLADIGLDQAAELGVPLPGVSRDVERGDFDGDDFDGDDFEGSGDAAVG
jgi:hypothetical protein